MKPLTKTENKIIEYIRNYDTPTISNSLELLDSSLRSKGHTQKTMHCLNPKLKPGYWFCQDCYYHIDTKEEYKHY